MKRRSFLKNSIATGAILPIGACSSSNANDEKQKLASDEFPLSEKTITEISTLLQNNSTTSQKVVKLYQDRIAAIDRNGPTLNSVIELNPDAMNIAQERDESRKTGNIMGPLHGIPIMLKDNIDTKGKMMTTAGSLALKSNYADKNAWVAQKLEDAGAIIIGKTNLSEWANFRSTKSSSGWSGRGRQTRNPYYLDRSPCGSSSGSATAVSANLCTAAMGTETNGSVVCPSSINGIVGIKPTIGLVSRAGIIPIAHSHDTAGPMTRTVADAAIMLGTLTGKDPSDMSTATSDGKALKDYSQFLNESGLTGKKIGLATQFLGFHPDVDALMEKAKKDLSDLGASIVEMDKEELNGSSGADAYEVLLYEFKHDLNKYLRNCTSDIEVRSLEELIEFNKKHADLEMPFFGQEILIAAQAKGELDSEEYTKALENVLKSNGPEGIDRALDKHNLDVIIAPTTSPAWMVDPVNGDHYLGGSSSPAARSGYPNITVPMGNVHGLPVGISFFAEAFSEPKLISIAYAYEQATHHRIPPKFITTFQT